MEQTPTDGADRPRTDEPAVADADRTNGGRTSGGRGRRGRATAAPRQDTLGEDDAFSGEVRPVDAGDDVAGDADVAGDTHDDAAGDAGTEAAADADVDAGDANAGADDAAVAEDPDAGAVDEDADADADDRAAAPVTELRPLDGAGDSEGGEAADGSSGDPVVTDDGAEEPGDGREGTAWAGLRPLEDDDLAALDPSALEGDLDEPEVHVPPAAEVRAPQGPASAKTAEDLTSSTVLRSRSKAPRSGWRRIIHRATGGTVTPTESRTERERAEQLAAIRTAVSHPRRIAVLSRKGGVGKTTTTLMLGQTLAAERGDRIVAVDGNPDAGNLGYRIDPSRDHATITDLLNDVEQINRYADVRRYTTQTSVGLEVLRSDDDPQISTALGDQEYSAIMSLLDRFYNLILLDTGTGILDSAVQGILDGTDQIVLVVAPSLDAARSASQTLDWLTEHGFVELVENAVAVINQTRRSTLVDVARIEDHFFDRCGATVRIPWDHYLEAGAETELDDLRPATREAYRHLAAAVARRFSA